MNAIPAGAFALTGEELTIIHKAFLLYFSSCLNEEAHCNRKIEQAHHDTNGKETPLDALDGYTKAREQFRVATALQAKLDTLFNIATCLVESDG